MSGEWNSLEIAKLAVGVLTPIFLFVLAYVVSRAARRVEQAQWTSQKLIERRLELYEDMAPMLNDLFCFFVLVGHFQEVKPPDAISRKRDLDRIFHAHAPLFTPEFRDRYQDFLDVCYVHFVGAAQPARLRASIEAQRRERTTWAPEWNAMFADREDESSPLQIANAYDDMMDSFASDVEAPRAGRRPRPWLGVAWDETSRDAW
jgi:plasmid stabilization system protein ParE